MFRIPRPSVVGRLLMPLITSGLWNVSTSEVGAIDEVKAELVEEAVGAALGICWRHRSLELETKRRDFDRGEDGLLEYGCEVLAELYEAGYTQDNVATLLNDVVSRLMIAIPASPKEVQEVVDFTVPRTDSETSSTSI
ncbi:hypothetical protein CMI37_06335 [Candidatus Pacearchaeota archaeon]|nr:hypothetical protein [Candidatus Pacearchaeota archaeon]